MRVSVAKIPLQAGCCKQRPRLYLPSGEWVPGSAFSVKSLWPVASCLWVKSTVLPDHSWLDQGSISELHSIHSGSCKIKGKEMTHADPFSRDIWMWDVREDAKVSGTKTPDLSYWRFFCIKYNCELLSRYPRGHLYIQVMHRMTSSFQPERTQLTLPCQTPGVIIPTLHHGSGRTWTQAFVFQV